MTTGLKGTSDSRYATILLLESSPELLARIPGPNGPADGAWLPSLAPVAAACPTRPAFGRNAAALLNASRPS